MVSEVPKMIVLWNIRN